GAAGAGRGGGTEAADGRGAGEGRRAGARAVEVGGLGVEARLPGGRQQGQGRGGGSTRCGDARDRVLERVARDDRARANVVLDELHHEAPHVLRGLSLLAVLGGNHRGAHRGDPQHLEGGGHRVGGVLAAAGAGARGGDRL